MASPQKVGPDTWELYLNRKPEPIVTVTVHMNRETEQRLIQKAAKETITEDIADAMYHLLSD